MYEGMTVEQFYCGAILVGMIAVGVSTLAIHWMDWFFSHKQYVKRQRSRRRRAHRKNMRRYGR